MSEIKLSLSLEQFASLQKLFYLGKWMLESYHEDYATKFPIEQEVEQLIYQKSEKEVAEFSTEFNMFFPSKKHEDEMHVYIDKYDHFIFWDQLADQLAERDTRLYFGDRYNLIALEEKFSKYQDFLEFYSNEFMVNNLNNLKVQ
jgi:hypothetical protein